MMPIPNQVRGVNVEAIVQRGAQGHQGLDQVGADRDHLAHRSAPALAHQQGPFAAGFDRRPSRASTPSDRGLGAVDVPVDAALVMFQSPRFSQRAMFERLGSPARKPGISIAGRPSPSGGSGHRDGSRVDAHSSKSRLREVPAGRRPRWRCQPASLRRRSRTAALEPFQLMETSQWQFHVMNVPRRSGPAMLRPGGRVADWLSRSVSSRRAVPPAPSRQPGPVRPCPGRPPPEPKVEDRSRSSTLAPSPPATR